jgi:hypothetical protein
VKPVNLERQLPPLRNPPILEAIDDLTHLSYLHEPDGMFLFVSHDAFFHQIHPLAAQTDYL